jgi:putative membrane protein
MGRPGRASSGGRRLGETGDATRRTHLANERTYLAWWRTGLTSFAVAVGSGKLIPAVASGTTWPYTAIGIGFAIAGVFCSVYALRRHREVEDALDRGEFVHPDDRVIAALSGFGAFLGLLLVIVLLAEA